MSENLIIAEDGAENDDIPEGFRDFLEASVTAVREVWKKHRGKDDLSSAADISVWHALQETLEDDWKE